MLYEFPVTDKSFREFFEQFGTVVDSIVMIDRLSKTSRGFGFVTFKDANVTKKLLHSGSNKGIEPPPGGHKSCKMMIHGRMCEIKLSEPKKIESLSNMSSQSSLTVPDQISFQNGAPVPAIDAIYTGYPYYFNSIHHPQHDPLVDQGMNFFYPLDQQHYSHGFCYDPYYYQYLQGTHVTPFPMYDACNSVQYGQYDFQYSKQDSDDVTALTSTVKN